MNNEAIKITCNVKRKGEITYINLNQETINQIQWILDKSENKICALKLCINWDIYWFESKFTTLENKPSIKYLLINIDDLEKDLNNL